MAMAFAEGSGGAAAAGSATLHAASCSHACSGQEAEGSGGISAVDKDDGDPCCSGGSGDDGATNDTPLLLHHLARLLRPVQQSPTWGTIWLYLTYHFKSDGSEARAAAQDALLAACRALQPILVSMDVEGRHSRSPNGPRAQARAHSSAAVTQGSHAEEEAAWVGFARGAAAEPPSLQLLCEGVGLRAMWGKDEAGGMRWPMREEFCAARAEEA
jgi:hypothetical protein